MTRRRALLARVESGGLDTSPIIEYYDKGLIGSGATQDVIGCCVTALYTYPEKSVMQTSVTTGGWGTAAGVMIVYKDGNKVDYWGTNTQDNYERACINPNSNGLRISLKMSRLDDAYLYIKDTGQILFAGRNSIYYGHRNINELN